MGSFRLYVSLFILTVADAMVTYVAEYRSVIQERESSIRSYRGKSQGIWHNMLVTLSQMHCPMLDNIQSTDVI